MAASSLRGCKALKSMVVSVTDGEMRYEALAFVCPGCKELHPNSTGLHMLPVNSSVKSPSWDFNGNTEAPTLTPSILTRYHDTAERVCHSFLNDGVFSFLGDSTHSLANQQVPMPDLPEWFVESHANS